MDDEVYFDGDPATDSARRHMERVLKGEPSPPRWPWVLGALGGGGLLLMWRLGRAARARAEGTASTPQSDSGRRRTGEPS
jgi:hypothetical protein